jgi:AcrR family transcriptional regulator
MPAHHEGGEEERRNRILDAASAVFARLGFHSARMDDIVAESQLSKGTLYWYFKSKDEIISGLLRRIFSGELKRMRQLEVAEGTVSERLLGYLRHYGSELERLKWLMPITLDFYAMAPRHAWVRQFFTGYYAEIREVLSTLVRQGVERGEFRDVPVEEAAATLITLMEGTALLWVVIDPQGMSLERRVTSAGELILDGLRARDSAPRAEP